MARAAAGANAGREERPEVGAGEPLAEWERDLYTPAGQQQSDTSPQTQAEEQRVEGNLIGSDAGELAEAVDEAGPAPSATGQPKAAGSTKS
jgi:small subunit ribosomal protein S2